MYGLHHAHEDEEREFLGWDSKPRLMACQWFGLKTNRTVFSGLALKPVATVFSSLTLKPMAMASPGLASKPVACVFRFGPSNHYAMFGDLGLKIITMGFLVWASKSTAPVWWFGTQNHPDGFLIWVSKPRELRFIGCVIKPIEGGRRETRIEIWRLASPRSKSW
jgi:hypothetical protein